MPCPAAHLGLAHDPIEILAPHPLDQGDRSLQALAAQPAAPGVGVGGDPLVHLGGLATPALAALPAGVDHGVVHLQFEVAALHLVGAAHHPLVEHVPILGEGRGVDRQPGFALLSAQRVADVVAVDGHLLSIGAHGVHLHDEPRADAALHVHAGHQEPSPGGHDEPLQGLVLALGRALGVLGLGQRAAHVRGALVRVHGGLPGQFIRSHREGQQRLQVLGDQRLPPDVGGRRAAEPVARDVRLPRLAVQLARQVEVLAVRHPPARQVHPVFVLGAHGVVAVRALGASVLPGHRVDVDAADVGQQLLGAGKAEQPDAWFGFKPLAALRALPLPPAPVAAVVDAEDAAHRRRLVRRGGAPVRIEQRSAGARLDRYFPAAHECGGPLATQRECVALSVNIVGDSVVIGDEHVAVTRAR